MPSRRKRYRKPESGGDGSFFKRMQRLRSPQSPSIATLDASLKEILSLSRSPKASTAPRAPLPKASEDLLALLPAETIAMIVSFLHLVPDILNLSCVCRRMRDLPQRIAYALTTVALPGDVRSCLQFQRVIALIAPYVQRLSCASEGVTNPLIWSAVSTALPPMPSLTSLELFELPDRVAHTRLSFPPLLRWFKYGGVDPVNWAFLKELVARVETLDSLEIRGTAYGAPGDEGWLKGRAWRNLLIEVTIRDDRWPVTTLAISDRLRRALADLAASVTAGVESSTETLIGFTFAEPCTTAMLEALRRCDGLEKLDITVDRWQANKLVPLPAHTTLRELRLAFPVLGNMTRRERSAADAAVEDVVASLATYKSLRKVVIDGCGTSLGLSHTSMRALSDIAIATLGLLDVEITVTEFTELGGMLAGLRDLTITGPLRGRPGIYKLLRDSCPRLRSLEVAGDDLASTAAYDEMKKLRDRGVRVY
ncbi:hypothetical protein FOZ61_003979 [Perkinsus olseni]|uniref:F-box domain-containing protein n=1 Tax=Perkinsus olseni TaxID=32597 RepID=A0A7J6MD38_PEROL|nr:hypothetical protein FOZ61_003979 [Perkinsus olseni]